MGEKIAELAKRVVWVEWVDSQTQHHWQNPSSIFSEKLECLTIGFVVHETDDTISITSTLAETGTVLDTITIPKCAITRMQEVDWT